MPLEAESGKADREANRAEARHVEHSEFPILEFDPDRQAVIDPQRLIGPIDIPTACVMTFFSDLVQRMLGAGTIRVVHHLRSEMGPHPVCVMEHDGQLLTVLACGVGAPLAAGFLEELIALGCRRFVACGGAGVLDGRTEAGRVIVPTAAVRDEGTSYHYLPPAREVEADPAAVSVVRATLDARGCAYVLGKTWTTDAFYRETPAKVALRRAEGCVTVEMEASALMAVARFRHVPLAVLLYAGDDVSGTEWDAREWFGRHPAREGLFWLAAEAALAMEG